MKQHRCHFDSGRRTLHGKRAYALCARDLYWKPGAQEFLQRMTADPTLVTCRACRAKPEYRAALLVLEPQVMAQVAVLLDWIMDHPGESPAASSLGPLLASLVTRGFPIEFAVQEPQRVLGYLRAAPSTSAAPEVCRAFIAQVEQERVYRARDRAHALAAGRVERAREEAAEQQQYERNQYALREHFAQLAARGRELQERFALQERLMTKHEDLFVLPVGVAVLAVLAGMVYFLIKAYL
jgi:hypothetical protein